MIGRTLACLIFTPLAVVAHHGNVEPDTGCHVEKASGTRYCHPERIQQSKEQIEKGLHKGKTWQEERTQRRSLAYIIADGEDVGQAMLANGLAIPYHGGTKLKIGV